MKWVISFQEITFKVLKFLLKSLIIRNNPSITLSLTKRYTLLAWYWMTWRIIYILVIVRLFYMNGSSQNTIIIFADVYIKKSCLFSGIMVCKFDPWMCIFEILDEIKQFLFRILPYKENVIQESKPDKGILINFLSCADFFSQEIYPQKKVQPMYLLYILQKTSDGR